MKFFRDEYETWAGESLEAISEERERQVGEPIDAGDWDDWSEILPETVLAVRFEFLDYSFKDLANIEAHEGVTLDRVDGWDGSFSAHFEATAETWAEVMRRADPDRPVFICGSEV